MPPAAQGYAALFTAPRITTLLVAVLVSVGSGTSYAYSVYAPQLGSRLQISSTQLNVIAVAGSVGISLSGPSWGKLVDARGSRPLLACAFVLILFAYLSMRQLYNAGSAQGNRPTPVPASPLTFGFCALIVINVIMGVGSKASLTAAINAVARSFPDYARATAAGVVISGYGVSALIFSAVAGAVFPGDTSGFLLFLAFGASLPMVIGFFFLRIAPLPSSGGEHTHLGAEDGYSLLPSRDAEDIMLEDAQTEDAEVHNTAMADLRHTHQGLASEHVAEPVKTLETPLDIHGWQLALSQDFWALFAVMIILTGTGLMWINNVGSMAQALFANGNPSYDQLASAQWQAQQVSTISFTNFVGRIGIGLLSDWAKNRFGIPRSYCTCVITVLFILSQIMATGVDDVHDLWKPCAVLGIAYGSMFSLFPNVTIDWFGMTHFSENWGWVSLSPLFGSNLFSIAFGSILDAHARQAPGETDAGADGSTRPGAQTQCFNGRACYEDSLRLTIVACCLALVISIWSAWRDHIRLR